MSVFVQSRARVSLLTVGLVLAAVQGVAAEPGFLGVSTVEGAPVVAVAPGSPAQQAGLRAGDVVTAVNDLPVTTSTAFSKLLEALPEGTTVRLKLIRDGKLQELTARLSARTAAATPGPAEPARGAEPARAIPRAPARTPVLPALKPKPGFVTGRVIDSAGKPLSGIEIGVFGTTAAGDRTRLETETGANGQYSLRVPDGIYGVAAYLKTTYHGKNYRFTLHPMDGKTGPRHDAAAGVVKDFVWRISGLKPGETPGEDGAHTETTKYYGGYMLLTSQEKGGPDRRVYFPQGSTLEITLTPRGPLIDGSQGQPVVFRRSFAQEVTNSVHWHLTNVPVGRYTMTARLVQAGGAARELNARLSLKFSAPFTPSVDVDFEPTSFGDLQLMQVTVEPPAG